MASNAKPIHIIKHIPLRWTFIATVVVIIIIVVAAAAAASICFSTAAYLDLSVADVVYLHSSVVRTRRARPPYTTYDIEMRCNTERPG